MGGIPPPLTYKPGGIPLLDDGPPHGRAQLAQFRVPDGGVPSEQSKQKSQGGTTQT